MAKKKKTAPTKNHIKKLHKIHKKLATDLEKVKKELMGVLGKAPFKDLEQ